MAAERSILVSGFSLCLLEIQRTHLHQKTVALGIVRPGAETQGEA
jgi:hypothetical protein